GPGGAGGSFVDYTAMRDDARGFEDLAAVNLTPVAVDLDRGVDAQRIMGRIVTANYFDLLGIRPVRGRGFVPADTLAASNAAVVIAHGFARRYFGDAAEAVGRTLLLNGTQATVVGVLPREFAGIDTDPVDVWVPAAKASEVGLQSEGWRSNPLSLGIRYVARLGSSGGVDVIEASGSAALRAAAEEIDGVDPDPVVITGPFITARGPKRSDTASVALWVALATGLLLVVACANVANLLLARAATRRREIAVRLSMGVGRGRLFRQLLTESLLLALLGCAAGLALAFLGAELARQFPIPPSASRLNVRMLAFAAGVSALTGVLFGLAPALQGLRTDAVSGLKEGDRTETSGRGRLRASLVGAQAALALIALVGAGLFLRSFDRAVSIDTGIEIDRIGMVTMDLASAGYGATERSAFLDRVRERLLALPGVEGVTRTRTPPLRGGGYLTRVDLPGPDSVLVDDEIFMDWVMPGYTAVMGTPLIVGRRLTGTDREGGEPVALVSEGLARRLAPDGRAASVEGECVEIGWQVEGAECTRIVGVVGNLRRTFMGDAAHHIFVPWTQFPDADPSGDPLLLVRTAGDPAALAGTIRSAVQGLAPDLPFIAVEPMTSLVRDDLLPYRIGAALSTLFGVLALVLAAVGLYGVLGYFVAQRTPEIGIRRSLGARDGHVIGLVVRKGLVPVAVGAGLGMAAALALGRYLESLLFGVSPTDPVTLGGMAATLFGVAVAASCLPARRAARVDPMRALRAE
ncbi:MAG: ADOP family duplicated permease, partial [Gemmatimonadota bacterium]